LGRADDVAFRVAQGTVVYREPAMCLCHECLGDRGAVRGIPRVAAIRMIGLAEHREIERGIRGHGAAERLDDDRVRGRIAGLDHGAGRADLDKRIALN
jgi:hypothetical protein